MKKNVIRVAVAALLVCAAGTARAVPTDGGEWVIGAGETELLGTSATISLITGYAWYTANDRSERDPSAWRLQGSNDGGTINSFRPAAGGTLELVNFPAEVTRFSGYEVPITVTDVQDAANLRSWTVTVNGVRRAAKVTYRDGKIMLLSGGTYVIVR